MPRGRFLIDEMPPGRVRVDINHPDRLPVRREPIQLGPGGRQDLGDIVLQSGALLAGRVLDETGRPIEGARVEARPTAKGPPVRMASDHDGNFALRVPGGDYALVAAAPAARPARGSPSTPCRASRAGPSSCDCRAPTAPSRGTSATAAAIRWRG
jgi:hypothetical protein